MPGGNGPLRNIAKIRFSHLDIFHQYSHLNKNGEVFNFQPVNTSVKNSSA